MGAMARSATRHSMHEQNSAARGPAAESDLRGSGRWPLPGTIRGQWTATDLDTLPDDGLRYELIDGTLLVSPAPVKRHQRASRRLQRLLEDACPAGYEVFDAPLDWAVNDTTVVEPDLLVIPRDDADTPAHSPVLLVEILSPSSITTDRETKFHRYERARVPQYWIVDPGGREAGSAESRGAEVGGGERAPSIEVYDLVGGEYQLQVSAADDHRMTVSGPVAVTLTPNSLVD